MKVVLKKIESNHTNLRTNTIEGESIGVPVVGLPFVLVGESLTKGADCRVVQTTAVQSVKKMSESEIYFETRNSKYSLEILPE